MSDTAEVTIWKSFKTYHDKVIFSGILALQVDLSSRNWTVLLLKKTLIRFCPSLYLFKLIHAFGAHEITNTRLHSEINNRLWKGIKTRFIIVTPYLLFRGKLNSISLNDIDVGAERDGNNEPCFLCRTCTVCVASIK